MRYALCAVTGNFSDFDVQRVSLRQVLPQCQPIKSPAELVYYTRIKEGKTILTEALRK
jgi:hypothetical protein